MGRSTSKAKFARVFRCLSMPIVAGLGISALAPSAHGGLLIVPTYDTSITSDPNAGTIETSINAAINAIDSQISNNITVTITFTEMTGSSLGTNSVGESGLAYTTYKTDLATKQPISPNDAVAIASLPATEVPVTGGTLQQVQLTNPLRRALGLIGPPTGQDGTVSLNTSLMNLSRTGTQSPSKSDLQEAAEHEIDEVLGIGGNGSQLGLGATQFLVGPLDFFRFTSAGTRSWTDQNANIAPYFSIDGGVTNIVHFSQTSGADYGDWGDGKTPADFNGNTPPQVQDAFSTLGTHSDVGQSELVALDVIGWSLSTLPEPASLGLIAAGAFLVGSRRRVRQVH
jgi:hypothetical protein